MFNIFSKKLNRKFFFIYNILLFCPIILGVIIEILFGPGAMMGISVIDFLMEVINQYAGLGAAGIMLFGLFASPFSISSLLVIICLFIYCSLLIRRINDIGINPAIIVLILIPFLSPLFIFFYLQKKQ